MTRHVPRPSEHSVRRDDAALCGRGRRSARTRPALGPARLPRGHGGRRARAAVVDRLRCPAATCSSPSGPAGCASCAAASSCRSRSRACPRRSTPDQGGLLEVAVASELRQQPLPLPHLLQDQGRRHRHHHGARARHVRERSPDRRAAALRVGVAPAAATSAARSRSTARATCSSRSAIARCRPKATSRRIRRRT